MAVARVMLDVHHAANRGHDPVALIATRGDRLSHVQIADTPGRHEPGTGHIPWDAVFAALAEVGYDGPVGLEYVPVGETAAGLAWRAAHA